jgi:hypothetical protein
MHQRFLPILLLTTLLGCSKSDSNPIMYFGEGEGITYRNEQNVPMGPRDYSDWTSDGEWNKQERALFPDLSLDLNGTQQATSLFYTTAYPNPAMGSTANWSVQSQRVNGGPIGYTLSAVLVDRNYHIWQRFGSQSFVGGYTYMFDYVRLGLSPNELYRIYYVVYNAKGLMYRGHGDVRYSPQ